MVQLLELAKTSLGPRSLPDVSGLTVEVAGDIDEGDYVGVVDADFLGASQNQILGDFYSELDSALCTPESPWRYTLRAMSLS